MVTAWNIVVQRFPCSESARFAPFEEAAGEEAEAEGEGPLGGKDGKYPTRLLWHGSRLSNYAGILAQGLRVAPPEAPVTGYMVRPSRCMRGVVQRAVMCLVIW